MLALCSLAFAAPLAAATITVDIAGDVSTPGACSLRDAVRAANLDAATQGCAAGAGADVIRFAAAINAVDLLAAGGGSLRIESVLTLDGENRNVTIRRPSTQTAFRVIDASSLSAQLSLNRITIRGGSVTSSDGGSSGAGGGINARADLTLVDSAVIGNASSVGEGGGLYSFGNISLTRSVVQSNSTVDADGGGISLFGHLTLVDSEVAANSISGTSGSGGGINAMGGATLTRSQVRDNRISGGTGGGINAFSSVELIDSGVWGNWTSAMNGSGGGIWSFNDVRLSGSAVFGNQTFEPNGSGAGIWSMRKVALLNSTVSGNYARTASGAGIVAMGADSTADESVLSLVSSTVATNRSNIDSPRSSSGIQVGSMGQGKIALRSSVVFGNSGVDLVSSAPIVALGSHSLVGSADAAVTLPADTLHCDPHLQLLAFNGGPTATQALAGDSCAIDAGNNEAALPYDQRGAGYPRVIGGAADIGAFEFRDLIFADGFDGG